MILLEVARAVARMGWGESWGHFQPEEGPHEDHGQHPTGAGSKVGSHARENRGDGHCRRGGPRAPRRAGLSSAGGTSGDGGVGRGASPLCGARTVLSAFMLLSAKRWGVRGHAPCRAAKQAAHGAAGTGRTTQRPRSRYNVSECQGRVPLEAAVSGVGSQREESAPEAAEGVCAPGAWP